MNSIFCFGELLLRMSPLLGGEWIKKSAMDVHVGGAELNVAKALARWGLPVRYGTALPDHYLSHEILEHLRNSGIDTSSVRVSGQRIGIYYLPQGADLKHAGVIYDRANSSFSDLRTGMIDWDSILDQASWFHFSAISPALNQEIAGVCAEALEAAVKKKITISVDLNYRAKLWQYGKNPAEIMPALVRQADLVMGNIWSAHHLLGIGLDEQIHSRQDKKKYSTHARQTALEIMDQFPKCRMIFQTFRLDEPEGIRYFATLDQAKEQITSREYFQPSVIDRVGTGDCFMAGLIYGLVRKHPLQQVIDFAAAAAIGKFIEKGDSTGQSVESVGQIMQHNIHPRPAFG